MIKKLPITIIIMASGFSKRMGEDKLSLQVDGKTLLSYCLYGAKNTLAKEKILITKNQFSSKNFKNIINNNSKLGQSHSIKLGILNSSIYKEEINQGGFMFLPADMPLLTSKHLDDLMFFFTEDPSKITIPFTENKNGVPVIFPYIYYDKLLNLHGDTGGREIIKS